MIDAQNTYDSLAAQMQNILEQMHHLSNAPNQTKVMRNFQIKEVESMTGKSRQTISRAEQEGLIHPIKEQIGAAKHKRYTLSDINKLRAKFGSLPRRDQETDDPFVLLVQNFKGGVSKSTTALNEAMALAFKGYRVLVIDTDPQASLTSLVCGTSPDLYCGLDDTIEPYITGEQESLSYAIKKSHIDGMDFIPSCSALTMVDVKSGLYVRELQEEGPEAVRDYYHSLKHGIESVQDEYDVIVIDSPPTLGLLSTMSLLSADGHIIPCPPMILDFASTAEYLNMASEVIDVFSPGKKLHFISILATKYSKNGTQDELLQIMRQIFGQTHMLTPVFHHRADILNLATEFKSILEASNAKRYDFLRENVDAINHEIESLIWLTWPSKVGQTPKQ